MGPYLGLWIFFAMVGLVTTGRSKVANCGNGGRDAWLPVQEGPAASSSSSPPGQGGPARWAAVTALETAARERVLGWRLERGLEDDADFAYRWASHEEAIAGGSCRCPRMAPYQGGTNHHAPSSRGPGYRRSAQTKSFSGSGNPAGDAGEA